MSTVIRTLVFALLLLSPFPLLAQDGEATGPASLEALIARALEVNPDLQSAESRWKMNAQEAPRAASLEDPMVGVAFQNFPVDSLEADRSPMTGRVLRLSQKFPFPGKLALRGEAAEQQALWYQAAYEDARLQLARMVKEAWFSLFFFDRGIDVVERNMALLGDFIRLTETRYEVGQGLQQDVLKAQVERTRLQERLTTLRQQRRTALANLNTLLDRPTDTPVALPDALEAAPVARTLEALQELSKAERPMMAAYRSLVERYKAQRALAKKEFLPDITVGAAYTYRESAPGSDGTDFVGLELSMNLPVYRQKRHAAVAQAESGIRMALHQYEDFLNEVAFDIHDSYAQMEKNRDLLELYEKGLIPQATQAYRSTVSAYQVGQVDFLSLLDSLMTLYRYNLDFYQVFSDYEKSVARLQAASGVDPTREAPVDEPRAE